MILISSTLDAYKHKNQRGENLFDIIKYGWQRAINENEGNLKLTSN